jgi:hypothetical protein
MATSRRARDFHSSSSSHPKRHRPPRGSIPSCGAGEDDGEDLIFISYSHLDRAWLETLTHLLRPYQAQRRFAVWSDPYIPIGSDWKREVAQALRRTKVGVVLVSPNLLASNFVTRVEMPAMTSAARRGRLTLFCIPISSVDIDLIQVARYQWARPPSQPLDLLSRPRRAAAMVAIVRDLASVFQSSPIPD